MKSRSRKQSQSKTRSERSKSELVSFKSIANGSIKRQVDSSDKPIDVILNNWDNLYCSIHSKRRKIFKEKLKTYKENLKDAIKEGDKVKDDFQKLLNETMKGQKKDNFFDLLIDKTDYLNIVKKTQRIQDIIEKIMNEASVNYEAGLKKAITGMRMGNKDVQNIVVDIITTFIESKDDFLSSNFLNFLIMGGAGSGKTSIAVKIGEVFKWLGVLIIGDVFVKGRSDLVGEYVGQTSIKTKALLTDSLESILIIDEAYLLGKEEKNGFGNEAVGAIVDFLDKNRGQLVVMALGYEKEMNKNFLSLNEGLNRRFPYKLILNAYSATELKIILRKMITKGFGRPVKLPDSSLFERALTEGIFVNQAGDMENISSALVTKMKASFRDKISKEMLFDVIYKYIQNNQELMKEHSALILEIVKASAGEEDQHVKFREYGLQNKTCSLKKKNSKILSSNIKRARPKK